MILFLFCQTVSRVSNFRENLRDEPTKLNILFKSSTKIWLFQVEFQSNQVKLETMENNNFKIRLSFSGISIFI